MIIFAIVKWVVIGIIISSFSMLLTFIFLVFIVLFYLCVYQILLNFKQRRDQRLFKVGNIVTDTLSLSLIGTLNSYRYIYIPTFSEVGIGHCQNGLDGG